MGEMARCRPVPPGFTRRPPHRRDHSPRRQPQPGRHERRRAGSPARAAASL